MLKRENRLTKDKEFKHVFEKGRSFKENSLFLKISANDLDSFRIGIIVSKKVSKKAVKRNKIKRQIREIVRESNLKNGFDLVIVTYPTISLKTFEEIKKELNNLFKKAKCSDL